MIKSFFLWVLKILTILVLVILLGLVAEKFIKFKEDQLLTNYQKVGVVRIVGPIIDSLDSIRRIRQFLRDESIKSIVIRIDSPGGAVGPSQELFSFIRSIKEKPIVSSMGSIAASGGLYVAVAGKKVFAQPGTITGSIGVIMQIPDLSDLTNKVGIKFETVKSGDLKDVGNIFRPLSDKEREFLKEATGKIHKQFIQDIALARGLSEDQVGRFADGRFLTGQEALEYGLIDDFGDIFKAAKASLELAGITGKDPLLVIPKDYTEFIKEILGTSFNDFLASRLLQYYAW